MEPRRKRDGEIVKRDTSGPRKTMKILSGTRFQWIAYNTETKAFMGTGGGTYTTLDGKYTENIGFFSRDDSRVGASLQFDYELKELIPEIVEKNKPVLLDFNHSINFMDINYKYPKSKKFILKNLNLKILPKSSVGISGQSGVGKSTLVKLLIGFFMPIVCNLF